MSSRSPNVFDLSVERLQRYAEDVGSGEEKVAALALIYAELALRGILDREDFDDMILIDDIVLSILTRAGARHLSDVDWLIVQVLDNPPNARGKLSSFAATVYNLDAARAEAMLHCWPKARKRPDNYWSRPLGGARFERVEFVMAVLRDHGLAVPFEDIQDIAYAASIAPSINTADLGKWSDGKYGYAHNPGEYATNPQATQAGADDA